MSRSRRVKGVEKVARRRGKGRYISAVLMVLAVFMGTPTFAAGSVGPGSQVGGRAPQSLGMVVRNPFQPPSVVTKKLLQARQVKTHVPQTPLEKYDLESFVLTGIVADLAMVVSPDGSTYIIKKGTRIGKQGEVVVGVYEDRVAVKRGDKIIYLTFPKD